MTVVAPSRHDLVVPLPPRPASCTFRYENAVAELESEVIKDIHLPTSFLHHRLSSYQVKLSPGSEVRCRRPRPLPTPKTHSSSSLKLPALFCPGLRHSYLNPSTTPSLKP